LFRSIDIAGLAAMSDNNDARMLSQQLPAQIQAAIDVTMDPKTNAGKANKTWMDLATSVQRAQSIAQFSGTRRTASGRVNPQAQKVADQLDLDDNQVAQMQQMARDPASLAALQQLIGMKK
jgi:cyanate lyase